MSQSSTTYSFWRINVQIFFEIASIPFEIKGQTEISIHSSMQPFIVENEEMVDVKYNVVCESNMKLLRKNQFMQMKYIKLICVK